MVPLLSAANLINYLTGRFTAPPTVLKPTEPTPTTTTTGTGATATTTTVDPTSSEWARFNVQEKWYERFLKENEKFNKR